MEAEDECRQALQAAKEGDAPASDPVKIADEEYKWAKRRVDEIKGFFIHACVFVGVTAMLAVLNVISIRWLPVWWFYWIPIFWGFGMMWHAMAVFVFSRALGKKWEEKEIGKLLEKRRK